MVCDLFLVKSDLSQLLKASQCRARKIWLHKIFPPEVGDAPAWRCGQVLLRSPDQLDQGQMFQSFAEEHQGEEYQQSRKQLHQPAIVAPD